MKTTWLSRKLANYPDFYLDDDTTYENEKIAILNRIDQVWTCDEVIQFAAGTYNEPEYCGWPEWDPFTNRCWDHTPGNLSSGHM